MLFRSKGLQDMVDSPGIMSVYIPLENVLSNQPRKDIDGLGIKIVPGIPYHTSLFVDHWSFSMPSRLQDLSHIEEKRGEAVSETSLKQTLKKWLPTIHLIARESERAIWESVRIFFIPLAALLWMAVVSRRQVAEGPEAEMRRMWVRCAIVAFVLGLVASGFVTVNGYRWELSRFAYPFFILGMSAAGIAATDAVIKFGKILNVIVLSLIVLSVPNFMRAAFYSVGRNIIVANNTCVQSIVDRLAIVARLSGIIDGLPCDKIRQLK